MKSITQQIDELRRMTVTELAERYEELFCKPPRVRHKDWLWRRIAWKLQEQKYGGISDEANERLEELISEIDLPLPNQSRKVTGRIRPRKPGEPPVGTTIIRVWRGREYRLHVRENGYEVDGILHKSLGAAAKAITGAHWNGRLFWGLVSRRKGR